MHLGEDYSALEGGRYSQSCVIRGSGTSGAEVRAGVEASANMRWYRRGG